MSESACLWTVDRRLPSARGAAQAFIDELLQRLRASGWDEQDVFGIHLAVEEAVVNAIHHGNRLDERKQVHLACRLSPERFWIEIIDEGPGFDPAGVPDCTAEENLCAPCGRGLMLMRSFMTRVEFHDAGNRVVMEKVSSSQDPPRLTDESHHAADNGLGTPPRES